MYIHRNIVIGELRDSRSPGRHTHSTDKKKRVAGGWGRAGIFQVDSAAAGAQCTVCPAADSSGPAGTLFHPQLVASE